MSYQLLGDLPAGGGETRHDFGGEGRVGDIEFMQEDLRGNTTHTDKARGLGGNTYGECRVGDIEFMQEDLRGNGLGLGGQRVTADKARG